MTESQRQKVETLVADLRRGALTEEGLRQGVAEIVGRNGDVGQDLLYLQAGSSTPASRIVGMMSIEGGVVQQLPDDPGSWPYQTVLEAMADGWRIISFPEMSLLTQEEGEWHGLGFQFVLERLRPPAPADGRGGYASS